MLFPEFVAELARSCQERGISVAIDTAGNVPFSSFALLLPYTDLFLYDVKALDCDLPYEILSYHRIGESKRDALL